MRARLPLLLGGILAIGTTASVLVAPDPVLFSVPIQAARGPLPGPGPDGAGMTAPIIDTVPLFTAVASTPTGEFLIAAGTDDAPGSGRVLRYLVEVEEGLPYAPAELAAYVHRVLNAPAGWGLGGKAIRFVRVDSGPVAFRISLSSPALSKLRYAPGATRAAVSCFHDHRAVLNAEGWRYGAYTYSRDLTGYRIYLLNHEVGHALGKGNLRCPRAGAPAPVMVVQTKSLGGCRANPWPNLPRSAAEPD